MTNSPQTSALMKRHAEECTDWMLTADSVARLCARMEHERNVAIKALRYLHIFADESIKELDP